jgi:dephospho-CoA kinase
MLIIGLTGGVASGKTAVSQVLNKEGAYIIDADQIARKLVQPHKPAWRKLIKSFGNEILQENGSIHRERLADKVFEDPAQRKILNRILHPLIKKEIDRRIKEIGQKDPEAILVIDAPLLVELGSHREVDKLIVVTSTRTQQIERLKYRDGVNPKRAQKIISSQMPVEEKVRLADFVIRNEGSIEKARKRAREIFRELRKGLLEKKRH